MFGKSMIACVAFVIINLIAPIVSINDESNEESIIQKEKPTYEQANSLPDLKHHEFYKPKVVLGNRNQYSNDSDSIEMDDEKDVDHEAYMHKVAQGPKTSSHFDSSTTFTSETSTTEASNTSSPPERVVPKPENMIQIPEGKVLFYFPMLESRFGNRLPSVIGVPMTSSGYDTELSNSQSMNRMSGSSIFQNPKKKGSQDDASKDLNPNKLFSCVPRYGCRMGLVCVDGLCHGCESTQECFGNEICVLGKPLIKFAMGLSLGIGAGTQVRAHSKINRSVSPEQLSTHTQEVIGLERLIGFMGQNFPEGTKRCVECGWVSTTMMQKRSLGNIFRSRFPNEGLRSNPFEDIVGPPIKIRFINISPLEIEIVSRNEQGQQTPLGTLQPPLKVNNCRAWTEITIKGGVMLEARARNEPQRHLYVGGRTEARASGELGIQETGIVVPIACQRHRFDLVENRAYDNGELDDWCF